jgi:hypothetical protein
MMNAMSWKQRYFDSYNLSKSRTLDGKARR